MRVRTMGNDLQFHDFRLSFKSQLKQFRKNLKRAVHRSWEDIEHVHQLRVSGRRLLAALSVLAPLGKPKAVSLLQRRIRKVVSSAGKARDLDLLIHGELKRGPHCDRKLLKVWKHERKSAQKTLNELHRRFRKSSKLKNRTRELCRLFRSTTDPNGASSELGFRLWCKQRIAESAKPFLEGIVSAGELNAIHQLRIDGKRFRYTLELLGPFLDELLTSRVCDGMKQIQETLGDLQDCVVARDHLSRTATILRDDRKIRESELAGVRVGRIAALDQQIACQLNSFLTWQSSAAAGQLVQDVSDLCRSNSENRTT
ncbi:MAG: CHAD domain-containing protein [Planctomyces sp.]|nr:CHAD domain-containing protein [Planctomyces sp.]